MKKREFLKNSAILAIGTLTAPSLLACNKKTATIISDKEIKSIPSSPTIFQLPALEYAFNALEPHIDALTMEIHHGKHWAAGTYYVYLEGNGWKSKANSFVVCN